MNMNPNDRDPSRPRPKGRKRAVVIIVIVALVLALGGYWLAHRSADTAARGARGGRGGAGGVAGGPPMPVGATKVTTGDINIYLNGLGTITPLRNVTVRSQVSGTLLSVKFKEGQRVNEGDLLAEIDPRQYQATLTQSEGALARDQALLANAKIDAARYQTLFEQDSIAKQQLDSQKSLVQQYEGTIKADQGQIDMAKLNITYSKITAPISGRVGLRTVDSGNYVQAGDSTGVAVITQTKPIDALFTLPEDKLPDVIKKMHAGEKLPVDAFDRAKKNKLASGTLASLDNQIDTSTGTVRVKAEFANDDESLFPNQFVNVRVLLDVLHDAMVIPTSALERGTDSLFVYVVNTDHTVAQRTIQTGPTEGERVAVTSGLKVGETIVTDGADRLREGSRVELPGENPAGDAPPAKTPEQSPDGQKHWRKGGTTTQPGQPQDQGTGRRPPAGDNGGAPGTSPPVRDGGAQPAQSGSAAPGNGSNATPSGG
ncbi:MAG: MdtA/MuxA family multidrug efflux RND transporter periplasmic adaptor subunit [Rudaea sp.]